MKVVLIALTLMASVAQASIPGSKHEERHQMKIAEAIIEKCGSYMSIEELSSTSTVIEIDQGIRDVDYVTILSVGYWVDQGVFDFYKVTVKSHFGYHFDHSSGNWGTYDVSSVKCELE